MKKVKRLFGSLIILSVFLFPLKVGAVTLAEYEAEVNKFLQEYENSENQIKLNDEQVKQIQSEIKTIQGQITDARNQISSLKKEIDNNNKEIAEKKEETKSLIEYKQLSQGGNDYLEYIFGAKTIKDMIYRVSLVEQITQYNKEVQDELDRLVRENKRKQSELETKQGELETLQKELEDKSAKIVANTKTIKDGMPSIQSEIDKYKSLVKKYKNQGCQPNDRIGIDCAVIRRSTGGGYSGGVGASTGAFLRPVVSGKISYGIGDYAGHLGIDITSPTGKGTVIYPVTDGTVIAKGSKYDSYGANIVKIAHNINGRLLFSTYAHMSSLYGGYSEGSYVSADTPLGTMGDTGYAFGVHLHLEMSTCDWTFDCPGYYTGGYTNSIVDPRNYISFPARGVMWYQR